MNPGPDQLIAHTKKWIVDVVVGLNFCPFAAREVRRDTIRFEVVDGNKAAVLSALAATLALMDGDRAIETTFLILPRNFKRFTDYLKLANSADALLRKSGHAGVYQVASFHPRYLFAGSRPDDAANYTNRSPYPMLHILREESVTRAVDAYPDTMKIPERNTALAREKGLAYMERLWAACKDRGAIQ